MRIVVTRVEAEGDPDELSQSPQLLALLRQASPDGPAAGARTHTNETDAAVPTTNGQALPDHVVRWVRERARRQPHRAAHIERFLAGVLALGGVQLESGLSKRTEDGFGRYVMLRASGPPRVRAGVKVYANNCKALFQLPGKAADGRTFARRTARTTDGYSVAVYLDSEEAVEEALELAHEAFDRRSVR
jgi:hypothetical protein